jgi:hypothetical protein
MVDYIRRYSIKSDRGRRLAMTDAMNLYLCVDAIRNNIV